MRSADQRFHWEVHKDLCIPTKRARTKFSKEEISIRNDPGDGGFILPARVFEEHAGHFWGIIGTRNYMMRRFDFVNTMLESFPSHLVALQTAVDHIMDMMRLNRSDNMGLRELVPALMLRLGRDQDAYDFVRWWATCSLDEDYDWGDMALPHLDTRGADLLEEPKWWTGSVRELSHASVVVLIKLRVLLTLRDLQNTPRALQNSRLPREIVDQVRCELLADSLLAGRRGLASADTPKLAAMIERVRNQILALYVAVDAANTEFWLLLLGAASHADENLVLGKPAAYSIGSVEEAELIASYNFMAWEETPGAVDELGVIWARYNMDKP
ncbi:hypothetical protein DHEL01_v201300 [Diaporthe helianthi]|uniref:Uncharacterized protein n=1 Tax=Diaporthe helianthi TaxID=158607 RepID=A0A2P5ICS6_DIAHE|nr:hypothetical protein DHEL01_v201300 [Diaporthe helianthi]